MGKQTSDQPPTSDEYLAADRRIKVSTDCYGLEVIYRTCYAFSDRAYLWLSPSTDDAIVVSITRKAPEVDLDILAGEFANALIDYALRRAISLETKTVREVLVRTALAEAGQ